MRVLIVSLILLLLLPILFVGWMNLTPGYFQETGPCGCNFQYTKDNNDNYLIDGFPPVCPMVMCQPSLIDSAKLISAHFDFNR